MKKMWFLLICIFWVSCTKVEIGYRLAPRAVMSKLDDAFDFNNARFKQIRAELDKDFKKNRIAVAAAALTHVEEINRLAKIKNISKMDIKIFFESLQKSRGTLLVKFKSSFVTLLDGLSADEAVSFNKFSEKKIKENEKNILKKDVFINKKMLTYKKVMNFLFDFSTKEQTAIFERFLQNNYDFFVSHEEYKKEFVKKFNSLVSNKPALTVYVLAYYSGADALRSQLQQSQLNQFEENLYAAAVQIWRLNTAKQKENLSINMNKLSKELLRMQTN